MATFDYSASVADALELISEFGQSVLIVEASTFDPTTGGTAGTPTSYSATGVVTSRAAGVGTRAQAQGDAGRGDLSASAVTTIEVLVAASGLAYSPKANDLLYLAATADLTARYRIRNCEPLQPAETAIYYKLESERS